MLLFMIFTLNLSVKSQSREFVAGSILGFYGIEMNGEVKELYSPTNGEVTGTGGLSFGFNVKHHFSKTIYGIIELRYSRKGSIYEFISSYGTQAFESIRLDYIEIPLMVGYKIKVKRKHLFTETGLAFARLIYSKMMLSDLNPWDCSSNMNNFKQNDYSFVAMVKYPVIKSEKLLVGFRFSHSLVSIHSFYKLYNMDYGIEVYYLFN